jgi:hypothetical protein
MGLDRPLQSIKRILVDLFDRRGLRLHAIRDRIQLSTCRDLALMGASENARIKTTNYLGSPSSPIKAPLRNLSDCNATS